MQLVKEIERISITDHVKVQHKWRVPRVMAQTKLELSSRSSLSVAHDEILSHGM